MTKSISDILFRSENPKKAKTAISAGQTHDATAGSSKFYRPTRITKPKGLVDDWKAKLNPRQIVPILHPFHSVASFASSQPGPSQPATNRNISKRHDLEIISVDYVSDSEPVAKSSKVKKQLSNSPELSFGPLPPSRRYAKPMVRLFTIMYTKYSTYRRSSPNHWHYLTRNTSLLALSNSPRT